jgi:hypothetical protein
MKKFNEILDELGVSERDWLEFGHVWRLIGQKEVNRKYNLESNFVEKCYFLGRNLKTRAKFSKKPNF